MIMKRLVYNQIIYVCYLKHSYSYEHIATFKHMCHTHVHARTHTHTHTHTLTLTHTHTTYRHTSIHTYIHTTYTQHTCTKEQILYKYLLFLRSCLYRDNCAPCAQLYVCNDVMYFKV